MGAILRKLNMISTFEEEKGEKKKEEAGIVVLDPSVDDYVLFYYATWQPGVPEEFSKCKETL